MANARLRLEQDAPAALSQAEAEVDVAVVGGVVHVVEAADRGPGLPADQHARRAVVVDRVALGVVGWSHRSADQAALRDAVVPDDVAGVHHGAVGLQREASDRTRGGLTLGARDEVVEPARLHQHIVLQLHEVLAAGGREAGVEPAGDAEVDGALNDRDV